MQVITVTATFCFIDHLACYYVLIRAHSSSLNVFGINTYVFPLCSFHNMK